MGGLSPAASEMVVALFTIICRVGGVEKELPSYLREGRLAMCVISRQRTIVTRRVTVPRDGIESATRKSEVSCSGFFQIHF